MLSKTTYKKVEGPVPLAKDLANLGQGAPTGDALSKNFPFFGYLIVSFGKLIEQEFPSCGLCGHFD